MYENYYSNSNIPAKGPAQGAKEVAMRARQQEKEMALLKAELEAEYAPIRRRSTNFFTGMVYGLLYMLGLN